MKQERWGTLDLFRGITVAMLIAFNGFYGFTNAPKWITHVPWDGYRFPDVIAPLFLFAVGMAMSRSLRKRHENTGLAATIKYSCFRGFLLIAFGVIGDAMCFQDLRLHWGTLEMIGGCIIASAPFIIFFSAWKRIAAALGIIVIWFLALSISSALHTHVVLLSMGGPLAVVAWSSIVLIGSSISDFYKEHIDVETAKYSVVLIGIVNASIFFIFFAVNILPNKTLVNPAYLTLSISLACALCLLSEQLQRSEILKKIFIPYGKNPLIMYMISGVLNQLMQTMIPENALLGQIMPYSIALLIISSTITHWLHKKDIVIKI